jgi:hypothetical protein
VVSRNAIPGELVAAPEVTKRSRYAGSTRSSRDDGGATPSSANQVSSMLRHTLALSIGVSAWSSSPSRRYWSAPSGSVAAYGANTPSSSARDAKVLSTPNATSPSGFSFVSTSLLVSAPASPEARVSSSKPLSCSNFCCSSSGSTNDSCVTRTTRFEAVPEAADLPGSSSSPPMAEQAEAARTTAKVGASTRRCLIGDSLSPVLTGSGS